MLSDDVQSAWKESKGHTMHVSEQQDCTITSRRYEAPIWSLNRSPGDLYINMDLLQLPTEESLQQASEMFGELGYVLRLYKDSIHSRIVVERDLGEEPLSNEGMIPYRRRIIGSIIYNQQHKGQIQLLNTERNLKKTPILRALDALGALYDLNQYDPQKVQLAQVEMSHRSVN